MVSRRSFIKTAAAAGAVAALEGPVHAFAAGVQKKKIAGANDKVNVALIGIGFRGEEDARQLARTGMINVVALCDVDMGAPHTLKIMNEYPNVPRYKDFRKMFDEMASKIDAVMVATPDFSHFPICMRAIQEGIHVYCEKPLTRTFHETELLIQAALAHPNVVTQMGNQGHSEANYFQFKAWKEAGIIHDVTAITAHMNSSRRWHGFDPAIRKFPDADPMPENMDWDTWLMQCAYHDYSDKFHRGNWRCWYDFGMGALGDWGAHILDTAHEFLDLGELIGAKPYFAANITSTTPQDIRDWMDYCLSPRGTTALACLREKNGHPEPWDIPFWGVGNENWGGGGNMRP